MSINQISYGTISLANLTDKQWQITENILDPNHRKRKYSLRDIMNAIMYLVKTGCQWRMLPKDFPPYNTVFYYFDSLPMSIVVHEANVHDSVGCGSVLDTMKGRFPRLKKMLADGGYRRQKLIDEAKRKLGIEFSVVLHLMNRQRNFPLFR